MSGHPLTKEFFKETVEQTVDEYLARPQDIRRGRLAAIVLNHMVDYWGADTEESLTSIRKTLSDATRFGTYSLFQAVMDVADVSKHARLESGKRTPPPALTKTKQVTSRVVGEYGSAPYGQGCYGALSAMDIRIVLNDGKTFSLSNAIHKVTDMWRKKLLLS